MQQRFKGMNSNSLKGSQLSSPQKQKAVDSVLTTFNENNLHKEKINDQSFMDVLSKRLDKEMDKLDRIDKKPLRKALTTSAQILNFRYIPEKIVEISNCFAIFCALEYQKTYEQEYIFELYDDEILDIIYVDE